MARLRIGGVRPHQAVAVYMHREGIGIGGRLLWRDGDAVIDHVAGIR